MAPIIHQVTPIGKERVSGFVVHGYLNPRNCAETWDEPIYPPRPPQSDALKVLRRELSLTLGDVADMLGVPVSVVSGLERGRNRPDGDDWEALFRFILQRSSDWEGGEGGKR